MSTTEAAWVTASVVLVASSLLFTLNATGYALIKKEI